jgi:hypothetical protein
MKLIFIIITIYSSVTMASTENFHSVCNENVDYYIKKNKSVANLRVNGYGWGSGLLDAYVKVSDFLKSGENLLEFDNLDGYDLSVLEKCGNETSEIIYLNYEEQENKNSRLFISEKSVVSIRFHSRLEKKYSSVLSLEDKEELKKIILKKYNLIKSGKINKAVEVCDIRPVNVKEELPDSSAEFLKLLVGLKDKFAREKVDFPEKYRIVESLFIDDLVFLITSSLVIAYRENNKELYSYTNSFDGVSLRKDLFFHKNINGWNCVVRQPF